MADGQQYDATQLDEVQHPTLGPLKFPKAMPFDERNKIVADMEAKAPKPAEKPTTANNEIEKAVGQESLLKKMSRGGALGMAEGAGLPETKTPVRDFAGNAWKLLKNVGTIATRYQNPSDPELKRAVDEVYANPREEAVKTANADIAKRGWWKPTWAGGITGAERLLAEVPMVGPGLVKAVSETDKGVEQNDFEMAAHGMASGLTQAALLGAGTKGGKALTETVMDNTVRRVTEPVGRFTREKVGTLLSKNAASTVRPEGAFQPPLANVPAEVIQHAKQEGINLTPFQATESVVQGKLQNAGEHGILGGEALQKAMGAERAKFGEAVNRLSERVDPKRLGLSEEQTGESIRQAAETAKSVAHDNASNAYKQIDYLMKEAVEPKSISAKWNEVRESLPMGAEEQILAQTPRNMRAVVEDLLSGKPEGFKPTFEQGIQLRKFFRDLAETDGLPSRTESLYKSMEKTVGRAMDDTAKGRGSFKEWDAANKGWKDYTGKYGDKQSPLYKILNQKDPTRVTRDLMNRASARDIEILTKEGMTSAIEPLRRQVLQDIARNKFRVGRGGLGGYSDSFLKQLFGDAAKKELYLKADLARRMNWEPNPSGSGGQLMVAEQLGKPSTIAGLLGAAKLSMPRDAASFLPGQTPKRLQLNPGMAAQFIRAANQQGSQP
jgi:hypothetical protein